MFLPTLLGSRFCHMMLPPDILALPVPRITWAMAGENTCPTDVFAQTLQPRLLLLQCLQDLGLRGGFAAMCLTKRVTSATPESGECVKPFWALCRSAASLLGCFQLHLLSSHTGLRVSPSRVLKRPGRREVFTQMDNIICRGPR